MNLVILDFNNDISVIPKDKFWVLKNLINETKWKIDETTKKSNKRKRLPKNRITRPKMTNEQTNDVLTNLQETAFSLNIWKEVQLKSFINDYINKLTLSDLDKLKRRLSDFVDLYKVVDINLPESDNMKNLFDMFNNYKNIELSDLLFDLIINTIILPKEKNKSLFDEKLFWIISRFYNWILNKILVSNVNSPIVFRDIDSDYILRVFDEKWVYSCYWNKELDSDTITNFWFNFSLSNIENYEKEDRISFIFTFKFANWKWIDAISLETMFEESNFPKSWNRSYRIGTNEFYNVYANLTKAYINDSFNDTDNDFSEERMEKCNLEFFVKSKISSLKSYDFLNEVLCTITPSIENFLNNIYKQFKDLLWDDYFKKDIIDVTSLARFIDQDWFIDWDFEDKEIKIWWVSNNKNMLWLLDLNKLPVKDLLLKPDLEDLVYWFIDNISNINIYKKLWLWFPKWALFYWNWWGWKTSICNNIILLSQAKKKVAFKLNIDQLLNSYLWQSEKNVKEIFKQIRESRDQWNLVFLFIDEVDWLMNIWSGSDVVSWTRSLILQELDWIDSDNDWIVVLATTNHIDKLSAPFIRRFSVKANIENPDKETIKKLFDLYLTKFLKTIPENIDLEKLYSKSLWKSAWFVEVWVIEAIKYSVFKKLELNDNCFEKTFKRAEFDIQEKEKIVWFN